MGILVLVEKAIQGVSLSQQVEPRLRDAKYERLPSQLAKPQYAAGSCVGAVVPGALVERGNLCVLAEPCLLTGSRPPLKRDYQCLRRIRKEVSNGIADAVQRLDFLQHQ